MINKLISVLLFAVWFKLFNVFFYSFFDIPVEFVTGEGVNQFKVYWIMLFMFTTFIAYKVLVFIYHLNTQRIQASKY
jgi:hypothetical protein